MKAFEIYVLGLNHKSASVDQRECAAVSPDRMSSILHAIKATGHFSEVVGLSTCNRTEWYIVGPSNPHYLMCLRTLLNISGNIEIWSNPEITYVKKKADAVKHLFRVASGLDSQVLGEPQILGQVKDAFRMASDMETTGTILNTLFHSAFHVGKRVRNETELGAGAVSVSSAVVELSNKIFSDLSKRTALLIGAGETGELTARHIKSRDIKTLYITNRTFEKAEKVAEELGGYALPFDSYGEKIGEVDIVISATNSPDFTVSAEMVKKVMSKRNHRPLFLIDIAVPRDIDPALNKLDNVFLNDIDDLNTIVNKNLDLRKEEIPVAEKIVDEEVASFTDWIKTLDVKPVIASLHKKFEQLRQEELEKARKYFDEDEWEDLDKLTSILMKKFLHTPMMQLREAAQNGNGELKRIEAAYELFDLKETMHE
ncbi:MAG: glutamyl-tRNA reductase [Candidatus Marinimicrobia bacterium]|nr:glutamyl-tRNA reductase [Candidatus Neomarinimicrobiota bacterium]MCF7827767.1 glutamyl-tRNA reductase [Candidatus Neomarinimicrobiota bacterium]MCF7879478.1 glutamyl-tRNA reductase [Candidatus Neomarinimicrobiota bacterium]